MVIIGYSNVKLKLTQSLRSPQSVKLNYGSNDFLIFVFKKKLCQALVFFCLEMSTKSSKSHVTQRQPLSFI